MVSTYTPREMKALDELLPSPEAVPPPTQTKTSRYDVSVPGANVFCLDDFWSDEECKYFRDLAEKLGFESIDWEYAKEYRDCVRVVGKSEQLARQLWSRILPHLRRSDLLARPYGFGASRGTWVPKGVNPCIRFTRYTTGHHFKPHRDGGFVITDSYRSVYTLMIYLNDDFEGGLTHFHSDTEKDTIQTVRPKMGTAILFNHDVRHEGAPVTNGAKYIIRTDIMFERVDLGPPGSLKDSETSYKTHPQYVESERLYQLSIELQENGDPKGSTEAYLQAMEIHATLPSILPKPKSGNKAIDTLPVELWTKILAFLTPKNLAILSLTNTKFREISRDPFIWSSLYKQRFPQHHAAVASSIRAKLSVIQTGAMCTTGDEAIALSWDWYSLYKHRLIAEKRFQVVLLDVGARYTKFGGMGGMKVLKRARRWWEGHSYGSTESDQDSEDEEQEYEDDDEEDEEESTQPDPHTQKQEVVQVGRIRSVFVREVGHYWHAGSGYCDVTVHEGGREREYDHTQRARGRGFWGTKDNEQYSFQPYRLDWGEGERSRWVVEGEVDPNTFHTIIYFLMQKVFTKGWLSARCHPFVIALPPFLSITAHHNLLSVMGKLQIPYLALIDSAVLSLLPHAIQTAIVVSVGASHVWVAPISKYRPVYKYPLPVFRIPNRSGGLRGKPEEEIERLFFTEPQEVVVPAPTVDLEKLIKDAAALLARSEPDATTPTIFLTGGQAPYVRSLLKSRFTNVTLSPTPEEDIVKGAEVFASQPGARDAFVRLEDYFKLMDPEEAAKEKDYWDGFMYSGERGGRMEHFKNFLKGE